MERFMLITIAAMIFSGVTFVQAQDGFVVWGEGSHCDRELKYNELKGGVLGPKQVAVKKGPGADIHVAISYDGVWISFSRFKGTPGGKYDGPCDYHSYTAQTIYIAKIDNGKTLPAEPKEIGYGCWSVWAMDEDAKNPNKPHTLYYTTHQDKDIKKVVIKPDGTFSPPETFRKLPGNTKYGTSGHIMMSPGGRYLAYRPGGIQVWDYETNSGVSGAGGSGCHPNWGPRSKYLIWSKNSVCRVEDGKTTMGKKSAGSGSYWQAWSNDKFYDEGKLWMIARTGKGGQNTGATVEAKEADISGGGYTLTGKVIKIGNNGTTCDIHFTTETGPDTTLDLDASAEQINIKEKIELTAKLVNEKDEPVNIPVNWTVTGGGKLSAKTGLTNTFTSDGSEGEFTIKAKAGADSASVSFKVVDPSKVPPVHIRINCGGPDVGDWKAAGDYVTGGLDFAYSEKQSAPPGDSAAPEEVYQTVRNKQHSYLFPDVPDGEYIVRIHFTDQMGHEHRDFAYSIEGKEVLSGFDPKKEAGGIGKGSIKSFVVTVSDGNGLSIEPGGTGDVFEAGIEIVNKMRTNAIRSESSIRAVRHKFSIGLEPHRLIFNNPFTEPTHLVVYDLLGNAVGDFHLNKAGTSYLKFMNELSNGFYFIHFRNSSCHRVVEKLLIK